MAGRGSALWLRHAVWEVAWGSEFSPALHHHGVYVNSLSQGCQLCEDRALLCWLWCPQLQA